MQPQRKPYQTKDYNIKRNCKLCGTEFLTRKSDVKKGHGKFCSLGCSTKLANKKRYAYRDTPNVECAHCGEKFYRTPYQQSKPKSGLFFCCRDHKNLAQRMEGIKALHLPHYGSRKSTYRTFALRELPGKCNRCEWNERPEVLQVHHKDRNRDNNELKNLEIVCPTCHEVEHFMSGDGRWKRAK